MRAAQDLWMLQEKLRRGPPHSPLPVTAGEGKGGPTGGDPPLQSVPKLSVGTAVEGLEIEDARSHASFYPARGGKDLPPKNVSAYSLTRGASPEHLA